MYKQEVYHISANSIKSSFSSRRFIIVAPEPHFQAREIRTIAYQFDNGTTYIQFSPEGTYPPTIGFPVSAWGDPRLPYAHIESWERKHTTYIVTRDQCTHGGPSLTDPEGPAGN